MLGLSLSEEVQRILIQLLKKLVEIKPTSISLTHDIYRVSGTSHPLPLDYTTARLPANHSTSDLVVLMCSGYGND